MKKIILLLFLTINLLTMNAQTLGKSVELKELGLSFEIPAGWSGGVQGDYILLGHNTIPGMMLLLQNQSKTAQELKNLAEQGIAEEGVALSPLGEFEIVNGIRVKGHYEGRYDGTAVKAYAVGLINEYGSGLSLLILTETNKFTSVHEEEANKLLKTVTFSEPQSENNQHLQFWKDRLVGKQLKYMFTSTNRDSGGGSTGTNETKTIGLCANGSFYYYARSNTSIDTGTNASRFNNAKTSSAGRYKIYASQNTVWLSLTLDTAEVYNLELSTDDASLKTFIDGSRYLLDGEAQCQ